MPESQKPADKKAVICPNELEFLLERQMRGIRLKLARKLNAKHGHEYKDRIQKAQENAEKIRLRILEVIRGLSGPIRTRAELEGVCVQVQKILQRTFKSDGEMNLRTVSFGAQNSYNEAKQIIANTYALPVAPLAVSETPSHPDYKHPPLSVDFTDILPHTSIDAIKHAQASLQIPEPDVNDGNIPSSEITEAPKRKEVPAPRAEPSMKKSAPVAKVVQVQPELFDELKQVISDKITSMISESKLTDSQNLGLELMALEEGVSPIHNALAVTLPRLAGNAHQIIALGKVLPAPDVLSALPQKLALAIQESWVDLQKAFSLVFVQLSRYLSIRKAFDSHNAQFDSFTHSILKLESLAEGYVKENPLIVKVLTRDPRLLQQAGDYDLAMENMVRCRLALSETDRLLASFFNSSCNRAALESLRIMATKISPWEGMDVDLDEVQVRFRQRKIDSEIPCASIETAVAPIQKAEPVEPEPELSPHLRYLGSEIALVKPFEKRTFKLTPKTESTPKPQAEKRHYFKWKSASEKERKDRLLVLLAKYDRKLIQFYENGDYRKVANAVKDLHGLVLQPFGFNESVISSKGLFKNALSMFKFIFPEIVPFLKA